MNYNRGKIETMQSNNSALNTIDSIRMEMGIEHPDADKGRYGDTEIKPVDGKQSHVNAWEAFILDQTKRDGVGDLGEELVKSIGSGTKNPKTGKDEYFLGTIASGIMGASKAYEGAQGSLVGEGGFLTTGKAGEAYGAAKESKEAGGGGKAMAFSAANALLPGAGMVLSAIDMIGGAVQQGKANAKKAKKLREGSEKLNTAQRELGSKMREQADTMMEAVGQQLSDVRTGAGQTLEQVSDKLKQVERRGGGLATGAGEMMVQDTTKELQEGYEKQTGRMSQAMEEKLDIMGEKVQEESGAISREMTQMEKQAKDLEGKTKWYQNIL